MHKCYLFITNHIYVLVLHIILTLETNADVLEVSKNSHQPVDLNRIRLHLTMNDVV